MIEGECIVRPLPLARRHVSRTGVSVILLQSTSDLGSLQAIVRGSPGEGERPVVRGGGDDDKYRLYYQR